MRSLAFIACCLAASVATAMPHAFRPAFRPIYHHHARPAIRHVSRPVARPVPRPAPKPAPVHIAPAHWRHPITPIWWPILFHHVKPRPVPPPPYRPDLEWVEPVYEDRPVFDAAGNVIRYERVLVAPGYWR